MEDGLEGRALIGQRSVGKLLHHFAHDSMKSQSKAATMGMDRKL